MKHCLAARLFVRRALRRSSAALCLPLLMLALYGHPALAADQPLLECAAVVDPTARLACYDRLAGATKPADEKHPLDAALRQRLRSRRRPH